MPLYPPKLMPSSLANLESRLVSRLNTLDSAFDRSLAVRNTSRRSDRSFLQEGLVSALWQTWCSAVRSLILDCVRGANTKTGELTISPHATLTMSELAFIASKAARGQAIGVIKPLVGSHLEPTWGDLNKIGLIIEGYDLSNGQQLISTLSSPSSLSDLQTCRNASAHLNADRIADIVGVQVKYSETKFMHPSDMVFWIELTSSDFLWRTWTDDMRLAYGLAVE